MEVKLVARTLELIELFAQARRPMPLTELAQGLGAPMSSCLALVRTLVARGYLYEVRRRGGYYPTAKLHALSVQINSGDPWLEQVRPELAALRDTSNETVMLGKIQDGAVVFVDVAESTQPVHYAARAGERRPLHTSAVAKAILARLPPAERDTALAAATYTRYTERTLISRDALLADVDRVQARGWASNVGESVADLTGLAVALDLGGEWYALCMAGPTPRVWGQHEKNVEFLVAAAELIRRARAG
ncbi:IclR family transcriptional regulator [Achromobacter seleniivolatilans]|uniref:IclR family transcriptional regulator n=1 Tax=Achromobacter seleniivolatilans TaxID=3047478 RepID=A0ABY9M4R6_9BURK|nr:IclR family transcriptional regulator [Achromobacter sp. R39]WMD21989.1 IclR family transcriptional regulator [Achromobacter sp. R39]